MQIRMSHQIITVKNRAAALALSIVMIACGPLSAWADSIVIPTGFAGVEGNANLSAPLDSGARTIQMLWSSDVLGIPAGSTLSLIHI